MKAIKKILSCALAASMVLAMSAIDVFARDAHILTISSDTTTGLKAGDTVVVSVKIDKTNAMTALEYKLTYDTNVFTADTTKTVPILPPNCIDTTWYNGINNTGDTNWGAWMGSPTINAEYSEDTMYFGWAGAYGIMDDYALTDYEVGKIKLTVNDVPDGTQGTVSLTGNTLLSGENIPTDVISEPLTFTVGEPAPAATIDSITIDPTEATVEGGATQQFAVTVSGTGDFDDTYTLSATKGTFDGDVFTAPDATEVEQVITITATANGDKSKTATATVTVPAKEEPPVTEEPTKVEFGNEGKAIFFDSEAKEYTLGTDMYINITSAEDGVTKKFGHQYFLNGGIEGEGTITATFGVVADAKYADGNFSFDIVNN